MWRESGELYFPLVYSALVCEGQNKKFLLKQNYPFLFSNPCSAVDAQNKFLHVLDLVDLPKMISKLQAMRIYAKAFHF